MQLQESEKDYTSSLIDDQGNPLREQGPKPLVQQINSVTAALAHSAGFNLHSKYCCDLLDSHSDNFLHRRSDINQDPGFALIEQLKRRILAV